jgi:hypothetical protein
MSPDQPPPPKSIEQPTSPSFSTGDGRVEILITPSSQPPQEDPHARRRGHLVAAFNVYCVWETADTHQFFDDAIPPTLEMLRPWRVTRRYSWACDLRRGLPYLGSGLSAELNDPAWAAIPMRPPGDKQQITDNIAPDAPAPPPLHTLTTFTLDLRRGMLPWPDWKSSPRGWDPQAIINTRWAPDQQRDRSPSVRPQRYRLWVTSVDACDQESPPVAVNTGDHEASRPDSVDFLPVRRTSLPPPPPDPQTKQVVRSQRAAPDGSPSTAGLHLLIQWLAPQAAVDPGEDIEGPPPITVSPDDMTPHVHLLRRPLRRRLTIDEPSGANGLAASRAKRMMTVTYHPAILPVILRLCGDEGYEPWTPDTPPEIKKIGNAFQALCTIGNAGRGYEYVAVVGMQITSEAAASFWAPDVAEKRTIRYLEKHSDDQWTPTDGVTREFPRFGGPVTSAPVPFANPELPRGIARAATPPDGSDFLRASPVPAVPGFSRDAILTRLLGQRTYIDDNGTAIDPVPWPAPFDGAGWLTEGQRAMVERALMRIDATWDKDFVRTSKTLAIARAVLTAEFTTPAATKVADSRQHLTVGFRGLRFLRWSYDPPTALPLRDDEADVEKFRISFVRVPVDLSAAIVYQTATVVAEKVSAAPLEYAFDLPTTAPNLGDPELLPEQFRGFLTHGKPVLVRIEVAENPELLSTASIAARNPQIDENAVVASVNSVRRLGLGKPRWSLTFADERITLGASATFPMRARLRFYLSQPIAEADRQRGMSAETYNIPVPVGGGRREVCAWWVEGVSAQGTEAGYAPNGSAGPRRAAWMQEFGETIEPLPPEDGVVRITSNIDGSTDTLDPANPLHALYLPHGIATTDDALFSPRLVVTWRKTDPSHRIVLERERVVTAVTTLRTLVGLTPWRALEQIHNADPTAALTREQVAVLEETWLAGHAVEPETPIEPNAFAHIEPRAANPITGDLGLGMYLPHAGAKEPRPGFVDYWKLNRAADVGSLPMDTSAAYRYRLSSYLDIAADAPNDGGQLGAGRYLRSRPTPWTELIVPQTPPIVVVIGSMTATPAPVERDTPTIQFKCTAGNAGAADGKTRWFYRVILKRQCSSCIASDPTIAAQPGWVPVGSPLDLARGEATASVIDNRVERNGPNTEMKVTYRLYVLQFRLDDTGTERLVRVSGGTNHDSSQPDSPVEFDVRIPGSENPESEVIVHVPVDIDRGSSHELNRAFIFGRQRFLARVTS